MVPKLLSPYCLPQSQDADLFAWIRDVFDTPLAKHHRLKAVAQRYTVSVGHATPAGAPVLLAADPVTGKIPSLTDVLEGRAPGVPDDDADLLLSCFTTCDPDRFLNSDAPRVGAPGAWRFILPGIIILQADDIAELLRKIAFLEDTSYTATWARCALATIRIAPPYSAHEQIHMIGEIRQAMALVRDARPEAFDALNLNGYAIGSVAADDLRPSFKT